MSLTEKLQNSILFLFILLLPTQFGKHFFFDFSYIGAIRVDYLALKLYTTDILALILILIHNKLLQGWRSKDIPLNQVGGYFVSVIQIGE